MIKLSSVILFLFLVGVSLNVKSQKITNSLSEVKIFGFNKVEYFQTIDLEKKDTLTMVYLSYQNSEYQHITDLKSVSFFKKQDVENFVKDLKDIVSYMGKKMDIKFDRENYYLALYKFDSKRLRIGSNYKETTVCFEKEIIKLIKWLESQDLSHLR